MKTTPIKGAYCRVADPEWADPLDPSYAAAQGQRWNPPGMECLYLNRDVATARADVARRLHDLPYGPEDLDPATAPVLLDVVVPDGQAADAYSDDGLVSLNLPITYPKDNGGLPIPHKHCQRIGAEVFETGLDGIDYRSAAVGGDRELAWFPRGATAQQTARRSFDNWW